MKIKKVVGLAAAVGMSGLLTFASPLTAMAYSGESTESRSETDETWVFDPTETKQTDTQDTASKSTNSSKNSTSGNTKSNSKDDSSDEEELISIDAPDDYEATKSSDSEGILTPEGNLSLVDDVDEDEAAELLQYMTVTTKDGSYFYIIVDRSGTEQNVHFLNAVDASDLLALMSDDEKEQYADLIDAATEDKAEIVDANPAEDTENLLVAEEPEEKNSNSGPIMLLVFTIIGALIGVAYYFFKIKPGKNQQLSEDDMEFYDDEEYEDDYHDDDQNDDVDADRQSSASGSEQNVVDSLDEGIDE